MPQFGLRDDVAVPVGEIAAAAVAWRFRGSLRITAIAKATFAFTPEGDMVLTRAQPIVRDEVHHRGSPARSIRWATDLVPYLQRADVLLNGSAYPSPVAPEAPRTVRLGIFEGQRAKLDKAVMVRMKPGGGPVPIVYESAYGSPGFAENPLGTSEPLILDLSRADRVAGFGPIGHAWPVRKRLLGGMRLSQLDPSRIVELPDDFNWDYYQAAPIDQRIDFLRGDEWIVVDGVDPAHAPLRTRLPTVRSVGLVFGASAAGVAEGQPIALHADMLRIDVELGSCAVTFRATFPITNDEALETTRVVLGVEMPGAPIVWPDPASLADLSREPTLEIQPDSTTTIGRRLLEGTLSLDPALEPEAETLQINQARLSQPPLPFEGDAKAASALRQASASAAWRAPHPLAGDTLALDPGGSSGSPPAALSTGLPFAPPVTEDDFLDVEPDPPSRMGDPQRVPAVAMGDPQRVPQTPPIVVEATVVGATVEAPVVDATVEAPVVGATVAPVEPVAPVDRERVWREAPPAVDVPTAQPKRPAEPPAQGSNVSKLLYGRFGPRK